MPPLWQYFSRLLEGGRVHSGPQRTRTPGPVAFFPANWRVSGTLEGDRDRPFGPLMGRRCARGEGHAPVVAVLLREEKKSQTTPLLPPKGADPGPPSPFPLQNGLFRGTAGRGHDRLSWTPGKAAAVMAGEAHAAVVAVLLASAKRRTSPFRAPKGHGPPDPVSFFPCKLAGFRDARRGP
jgi:hypothetical protein